MSAHYELVPVTVAGAFTCGTLLALTNAVRLPLARRLGVSEARSRLLPSLVQLGLVPALLLSGLLVDRWGAEWVLIVGALLASLSVAGLALAQRFTTSLITVALLGAGGAAMGVAANVLMPRAFDPAKPVLAVNLGHVFLVLGVLASPLLCDALLDRLGFRQTMGLLALFCLVPAAAASLTEVTAYPPVPATEPSLPLEDHLFWAAGLVFLLYGPLECMLAGWLTPHLTELGCSPRRSAWLMTGFWLALLASRLLVAVVLQHGPSRPGAEAAALAILALAAGVIIGNLAGTISRSAATWGVLMLGVCLGPVLPTLIGLVFERFPLERGSVYGALAALSALGGVVLLPLIDAAARRGTAQRALRWPMVTALGVAAGALVFALMLGGTR
jgi:fucose permease